MANNPLKPKNMFNKLIVKLFIISFLLSFMACDGIVGEEGVVQNKATGERLVEVNVILNSHYDKTETTTNRNGFFQVFDTYSCGLSKCNDDFTITFEKEGFQTFIIDQDYYNSSGSEFVNNVTKDTLMVKMDPSK